MIGGSEFSDTDANSFFKLSDEQIYWLGGTRYYLRFQDESGTSTSKFYLTVDNVNWTDTSRAMGYAGTSVGMCVANSFGGCVFSSIPIANTSGLRAPEDTTSNTCSPFGTDLIATPSCGTQQTGKRCFTTGTAADGTYQNNCGGSVLGHLSVWIKPQDFNSHADCEDFSGYYMDNGGFTVFLQQFGCLVQARNYARWPNPTALIMENQTWANNTQGTVKGERVTLFGLVGWTLDLANNPQRDVKVFGMSKLIFEGTNSIVPYKEWYREPCNRFNGLWAQDSVMWLVNQSACDVNITQVGNPSWPSAGQPYELGKVVGNTMTFAWSSVDVTGNLDPSLLIVTWSNSQEWNRGVDWL
jgi:hypothetical protein